MKKIYLAIIFLNVVFIEFGIAQTLTAPEWINYTNGQLVHAFAEDHIYLWIGTEGGLVKFNKVTNEKIFFNCSNSGLPSNRINALAFDTNGNLWIGTDRGVAIFNGVNWIIYDNFNSGLPDNFVSCISI